MESSNYAMTKYTTKRKGSIKERESLTETSQNQAESKSQHDMIQFDGEGLPHGESYSRSNQADRHRSTQSQSWIRENGPLKPFKYREHGYWPSGRRGKRKRDIDTSMQVQALQSSLCFEYIAPERNLKLEARRRTSGVSGFSWDEEWERHEDEIATSSEPPLETDEELEYYRQLDQELRESLSDDMFNNLKKFQKAEIQKHIKQYENACAFGQRRWLRDRLRIEDMKARLSEQERMKQDTKLQWNIELHQLEKFRREQIEQLELEATDASLNAEYQLDQAKAAEAEAGELKIELENKDRFIATEKSNKAVIEQQLQNTEAKLDQSEMKVLALENQLSALNVVADSLRVAALQPENQKRDLDKLQQENNMLQTRMESLQTRYGEAWNRNEDLKKDFEEEKRNNSALKAENVDLKRQIAEEEVKLNLHNWMEKYRKLELENTSLKDQRSLQDQERIQVLEKMCERLQNQLSVASTMAQAIQSNQIGNRPGQTEECRISREYWRETEETLELTGTYLSKYKVGTMFKRSTKYSDGQKIRSKKMRVEQQLAMNLWDQERAKEKAARDDVIKAASEFCNST